MARLGADQIARQWGEPGSGDRAPAGSGFRILGGILRRQGAKAIKESAAWITVGDHAEPLLKLAHRVAQIEIEVTVDVLDLVAERGEPALERDALLARRLKIVGRPSRLDWRIAVQPVGEHRDRKSIGVRIVEPLEHHEIVGDEKGRPGGAAGKKQDGVAGARPRAAVSAAQSALAPFGKRAAAQAVAEFLRHHDLETPG